MNVFFLYGTIVEFFYLSRIIDCSICRLLCQIHNNLKNTLQNLHLFTISDVYHLSKHRILYMHVSLLNIFLTHLLYLTEIKYMKAYAEQNWQDGSQESCSSYWSQHSHILGYFAQQNSFVWRSVTSLLYKSRQLY